MLDHTRNFMPECHWERMNGRSAGTIMSIRVANAGRPDADKHIAAANGRHRDFLRLQWSVGSNEANCFQSILFLWRGSFAVQGSATATPGCPQGGFCVETMRVIHSSGAPSRPYSIIRCTSRRPSIGINQKPFYSFTRIQTFAKGEKASED